MTNYLHFPSFDPVIFSIGPVSLHWYGLMYLVGFVFAMWLAVRRANKPGSGWTKDEVENLLYVGFWGSSSVAVSAMSCFIISPYFLKIHFTYSKSGMAGCHSMAA